MNRKQSTILLVLVLLIGSAGLVTYKRQNASRDAGSAALGRKLLGEIEINNVAQLVIKGDTNELNLVREDGLWRVKERYGYPANFNEISDTVLKLRDLKIVQTERVGESQLVRLSLAEGQGANGPTVVVLRDKDGVPMKTLWLGKKHMKKSSRPSPMPGMDDDQGWPDGRYVKLGGSTEVALVSDPLANLEPRPEQWLNKDFLKVEKVKSIAVDFPEATNSWKVTRETEAGPWRLFEPKAGEDLDSSKLTSLSSPLGSLAFNDVAPESAQEHFGLQHPVMATLETFDHFAYAFKVGLKTNENYPIRVAVTASFPKERPVGAGEKAEDKEKLEKQFKDDLKKLEDKLAKEKGFEPWIFEVSSWSLDSLLKRRSELMVEQKPEQPERTEGANEEGVTGSTP